MSAVPVLEVDDVSVTFPGGVQAVRGLSFRVDAGEVLALVGESGAGKTAASLAVLSLLPRGTKVTGSVRYRGDELLGRRNRDLNRVRGDRIGTVFQDPMTSLNPVQRVGPQVAEVIRVHREVSRKEAQRRAVHVLGQVGLPAPEQLARAYPHELSGGMRQRVMIAIAMANEPDLIIADEPTTALDVTVQAQILETLEEIRRTTGVAVLLITHDFGLVANLAHRVVVMYAGRAVETGTAHHVFTRPSMPYTQGLLAAVPQLSARPGTSLVPIAGSPPEPSALPAGCPFHPRCWLARDECQVQEPGLEPAGEAEHFSACHFTQEARARRVSPVAGGEGSHP